MRLIQNKVDLQILDTALNLFKFVVKKRFTTFLTTSGVVRGVAGVAKATPIFQILFYKIVPKISQKFFYLPIGYPNLKFLTSSLNISHKIGHSYYNFVRQKSFLNMQAY